MKELFIFYSILFIISVPYVTNKIPPGYTYCQADLPLSTSTFPNLDLQLVQIMFRHGDRTPVNSLPVEITWDCALNEIYSHQKVPAPFVLPRKLFRKQYINGRNILPGTCLFGQLTTKGAQQHEDLGASYSKKYKNIINTLNSTNGYIRSTDVPRTLASCQHNLMGWFDWVDDNAVPPEDVYTMDNALENMIPNFKTCPRLAEISVELANTPQYIQHKQQVQPFMDALCKILNITSTYFAPGNFWMAVMDILEARRCWGYHYPPGITDAMIDNIMDLANWESEFPNYNNESMTLGVGPILNEYLQNFQNYISQPFASPKLFIFSGHDYSVSVFTFLLNITDHLWPPYRSHVELELYKDRTTGEYWIRFEYNGKERPYPACTNSRGNLCQFNSFKSTISKFIPTNYQQQCKPHKQINYNLVRESPFRSLVDPLSF